MQAIAGFAESPRMPTAAKPTFVFPTRFSLDEDTYDEASEGVRDDAIVDDEEPGEYGDAVLVLEDRATGSTEVVALWNPSEVIFRGIGDSADIQKAGNSWRSSVNTRVRAKKKTLQEMYLALKGGDSYALSGGVWVVGISPAFPSSLFIPIVYQGKAEEVPRAVLRSSGNYDYLVPVEGGNCDKVVTYFEDGGWEVQESVHTVGKSEKDRILQLEADGYYKVEPVEFDGEVNPEEHHIMARQELRQKVFRSGPTSSVEQSNVKLTTTVTDSPRRKSQKRDPNPHA
jgi:hypothetical protein